MTDQVPTKILYVITKGNFGRNKNCFLFLLMPQAATVVEQVAGGPTKFSFV